MFLWLAFNTLCALPLALAALLVRRLPRVTPALEHLLWLLVLVRLVLPPFSFVPGSASGPAPSSAGAGLVSSAAPGFGDVLVARTTRLLGPNWSSWGAELLLWLFLATLLLVVVRELARVRAVERCVRRSEDPHERLARHVRAVARDLGVPVPAVRVLPEASGPFLWSLRRPVLVLPAADALPAPTVVAHELAHLRRRDHWTAWLELAVQALHFWNPLFWLARRQLHRAAELACDQWVVTRFPGDRRAFAAALIDTAERATSGGFVPRAAQAIGMDRRDFEERLVRILRGDATVRVQRGLTAAAFLIAALTLPGLGAPTLADFRAGLPELPAGLDHETWRRSLAQAETLLAADPNHGGAVMQRGIALLCLGRAEEALASFRRQEELGHRVGHAIYNQACAEVKLGQLVEAISTLMRAAEVGLDVPVYVASDPDLAALRAHPEYTAAFGP